MAVTRQTRAMTAPLTISGADLNAESLGSLFVAVVPDVEAPIVQREALQFGVLVRFLATAEIERAATESTKAQTAMLHTFRTRPQLPAGQPFALWGAAELDGMLRKVKPGALLYVRHLGKAPHPTDAERTVHRFSVREATSAVTEYRLGDIAEQWSKETRELERAIAEAEQTRDAKRAQGLDDDDFPVD